MGKSFRHHKREKFTDERDREARIPRRLTVDEEAMLYGNVVKFPSAPIDPEPVGFCEEHFGPLVLCQNWHGGRRLTVVK